MEITDLRTSNEIRPIGITAQPSFRWKIDADGAFSQKAFRIRVTSDIDSAEVLDTGFIESTERQYLCTSFPSDPFTSYAWTVSILDGVSGAVTVSREGHFVTGVFHRSQWKYPFLFYGNLVHDRRIFYVRGAVSSAFLFIASCGDRSNAYDLYLNGFCVNDGDIRPGPEEYMSAILSGYEVTDYLRPGENNVLNIDATKTYSAVLRLNYADGGSEFISVDKQWQTNPDDRHTTLGYLYDGVVQRGKTECFDTTLYPDAWYSADDTGDYPCPLSDKSFFRNWGPVFIRYDGVKSHAEISIAPTSIWRGDKGWIVDFGKIQAGYVKLRTDGAKAPIRIQYAEYADEHAVSEQQYAHQNIPRNEFIPHGLPGEEFHPHFMHTSFRYVEIESEDFTPTQDNITAEFVYPEVDGKSAFSCGNEQLDYVMRCARRSFLSNLINIPTDCAGRERRGWSGDSIAVIEAEATLLDVDNLYRRWLADLHDAQSMSGWVHVEYPESTDPCIDISWPMHIVIVPWALYRQTGDKRFLSENIDSMERYADMLCEISDGHLFSDNLFTYGDWVSIVPAERTFLGETLYAHITELLSFAEAELGNSDKAELYRARFHEICDAVNRVHLHVTEDAVTYNNGSQSAATLALAFGICPPDYKERAFRTLTDAIETTKTITVGFFANTWLYRVLGDNGRNDLALRLLTDTSYTGSSIPNMVNRLHNETMNENFRTINDSLNHAFLGGGPASWVTESLVGLLPETAGYKTFTLRPYLTPDVPSLSYSVMTPMGQFSTAWEYVRENDTFTLHVTVPYDTEGILTLPGQTYRLTGGTYTFENQ